MTKWPQALWGDRPGVGPWRRAAGGCMLLVVAAFSPFSLSAQPGDATIQSEDAYWEARRGEGNERTHSVAMEFTVAYYDPAWNLLWVERNGEAAFLPLARKRLPLRSRQRVRIEGDVIPARGLDADTLRFTVLAENVDLVPVPANGRLLEVAGRSAAAMAMVGYVDRQTEPDPNHLVLDLIVDDHPVRAQVWLDDGAPVPQFAGQRVHVVGTGVMSVPTHAGRSEVRLWVAGGTDVTLAGGATIAERFAVPVVKVEQLRDVPTERSVRLAGHVFAQVPGYSLTMRDETGQIELLTPQTLALRLGDAVEVIGHPVNRGTEFSLRDVVVRSSAGAGEIEAQRPGSGLPRLGLAEQALHLMPEEAGRGYPVDLTGVVTFVHPAYLYFFLTDASGGLCVNHDQTALPRPAVGDIVRVGGRTVGEGYATMVRITELEVVGQGTLPPARPVTLEHALTGVEDAQWVEMRGFLRQIGMRPDEGLAYLTVVAAGGEFVMRLPATVPPPITLGSVVRARGVCSSKPVGQRQVMQVRLCVPSLSEVLIDDAAPADPFSRPVRKISSLRQYQPAQTLDRQVRVQGVVIQHLPGRILLLAGDTEVLRVLSRDTAPLAPGDVVDVVGVPGRLSAQLVLRESVYRKIDHGMEPAPLDLPESVVFDPEMDSRLVRLTGRVLDIGTHDNETRLFVQTGTTVCETVLPAVLPPAQLADWRAGTQVRVTGVYRVRFDEYNQPEGFNLQLRSGADVVVLQRPSWWTARRALAIAGIFCGLHVLGLVWAGTLRRRVRQQTNVIRTQLENESTLEARFRDIVENASDFILTVDLNGRFTSFNPAGEQLTGYPRAVALRLTLYDMLDPRDARLVRWTLNRPERRSDLFGFQTRLRRRDGSSVWIEASARIIREQGRVTGVLGVVRDISARKQVEEELKHARDAAEANTRAKSLFLANMSHEIRTPMNGVIGMSHLLLDTDLDEQQRDFADTIRNSAESLLTVLNDILDFSKIEAGKLHFENIDFPLGETVDDALELLAARAAAKNLELAAFVPHDLPPRLRGDPGRLRQVLLNLAGNAIKFTAEGEIVVRVARESETDTHMVLRFEVTDTGVGIAPEAQKHLFQAFHQADNSMTRKFGGTGLGLVISKQIVELLHGTIGVNSTPGQGSTFWFTIQLEKAPPPPGRSDEAETAAACSNARVLVVDDNAINRKLVQHFLEPRGLRVTQAADAASALHALREAAQAGDPFRLILLDLQMPDLDGLSLGRAIHGDPQFAKVPIVLLASLDRPITADIRAATGIVACLTKPIRQADLWKALRRHVGGPPMAAADRAGSTDAGEAGLSASRGSAAVAGTFSTLRVLVAEDNVVNQRLTCLQLQKLGLKADIAADGREVLEAVERAHYDVILMDCQMPEVDGFEATQRLRASGRHIGLRIVAMTANAMQGDRERCLESGMDDYLSKPTRLDDLRAALARCVSPSTPRPRF